MSTIVFANFPVTDVKRSTEFYEALGFKQNKEFSTDYASAVVWDESFWIMLLTHDFYQQFLKEKEIADPKTVSSALVSFSVESADAVQKFADAAQANGGSYFYLDMGIPKDQMFSLEVLDPDGNQIEPVWMAM